MTMYILDWALRVDKPSKFEFFHIVAQSSRHSSTEWGCRKEESHIVRYGEVHVVPIPLYQNFYGERNPAFTISMFGDVRLRGSRFYCPSHTTRIIESDRAVYFEDEVNADPNFMPREIPFGEEHVVIPFPTSHVPNMDVFLLSNNQPLIKESMEHEYDSYDAFDPVTYQEAIHCPQFISWKEAMDDEMNSMYMNGVWDLVELPHGCYSQREGIDFKETFSPVSTKDSFRVIMAIVAHFDLELHQMDVKIAFLNGDLDEEVYMEQPIGFVEVGKEDLVCKLNKSIYGLKQASRQWYLKFDKIITQNGFKENTVDRCIYLRDLGEASYVLGIKILRDRANGVLKLSQRAYIERILKSLMYAQVCTRPDIAFVVGMLGRYLSNPGSQHWKAAKKVLRYLQGTKDLMLTYQRTSLLDVVGFCDADFAGCIDDKKSTTGYIFMMAGGAVSWKSVKQTLTASSTMEAEYVTCYEACCHAMWMRNFVSALGVVDSISRPLKLFCDNSAAVAFSKNTRSISRSKHIDVKFYFVKEKVAESLIDIEHMSTKSMLADPLTKGLPIIAFQEHVSQMGLLEA
ncbi:Retrovirus-related Pol polyprotein from transposon TNT 1-94 [Vitis vinifera]|uniref:Retrovirus-related Pol polyprotein from transposon TNT 1-94 n=1 Tax=Vitis vinifera TaxID=29760 RepID=A0A438BNQ6_VITVI|nr:Retrovirus-related Pol polyprotein from transposon TNT 1-94 [Vitis vinifera]